MSATPGKFVDITTGEQFDAYEDRGIVGKHLTKNGSIAMNRSTDNLPRWIFVWRETTAHVSFGRVARFEDYAEGAANETRAHIKDLEVQLAKARSELRARYAYQAGPRPADRAEATQ